MKRACQRMKIDVINCQNICIPNIPRIRRLTALFMRQIGVLAPNLEWDLVSVLLTDDSGIRLLKQTHFGINEVTDVISVRYDPIPGDACGGCTGEIAVNAQRAQERKETCSWNANKELGLYIAHGCDHLSGAEDRNVTERARMRRRELVWLKKARMTGLLDRKPLFSIKLKKPLTAERR